MASSVILRFLGDSSSLDRTFKKVGADSATLGSKMSRGFAVAGIGAASAGVAVTAFVKGAVSGASDMAESMSKVSVVFGKATKDVTKFANDMARQFGLPKREILDAVASIGLVGKAAGQSQSQAAKLGTNMAKLAADASSFYNVPLAEALDTIKSALVGESEPIRKFGVLLNEAAVKAEAVRLGIAKTGDELTESQKVMARSSLITKGMSDASGDLARTQGSLSNQSRELAGRFENIRTELGAKLVPILASLATATSEMIVFFQNLSPVGQTVAVTIGALAAGLVVLIGVVKAYTAVQAALNVVLTANPIGLIVVGIAALAAAFVIAYQKSEMFRNVVHGVMKAVEIYLTPPRIAIEAIVKALQKAWELAGKVAGAVSKIPGAGVVKNVGGFLGGLIPGRAAGGPVSAGGTYLVGERGPELMTLGSRSGYVTPNNKLGGGGTINVTIHTSANPHEVIDAIKRYERGNGTGWRTA